MNGVIHRHILMRGPLHSKNIIMMIGILLCVYFSYHLFHGQRSLVRLHQTQEKITLANKEFNSLYAQRQNIETKVKMLRPGMIDSDLLEERIRIVLGFAGPNDYIISTNKK